jgi:hypothetical protein
MRILIIALFFVSCSKMNVEKEIALPDGQKIDRVLESLRSSSWWWYTGFGEDGITGNRYGTATTFTIPNFGGGVELRAAWVDAYFNRFVDADGVEHAYWAQWGVGKHSFYGLVPIFVFYDLFKGEIDPHAVLVTGGISQRVGDNIRYSFYLENGEWLFARNGIVIWKVVLPPQITHIVRTTVMTEMMADKAGKFVRTKFYPGLEIKDEDGWKVAQSLKVLQCNWGIEGSLQNSSLRFGEVNIGGSISKLPFGTKLY